MNQSLAVDNRGRIVRTSTSVLRLPLKNGKAGELQVADDHAAEVSIRIGTSVTFDAKITGIGLLSVGALVSGILLSTAVIVFAARRKGIRRSPAEHPGEDGG